MNVLITGGTGGIGFAVAEHFGRLGHHVILADINSSQLDSRQQELTAAGYQASSILLNLMEQSSIEACAQAYQIDILINNAGTIMRAPAAEHPDEYWDRVLNINLDAQFILAREIGKHMIERGTGKIIFTCSLLSFQGGVNVPGYAASKGALSSLVKALANEWASKGVNVNGIAPGYIATDNTEALRNDPDRHAAILARIPAGHWGDPADLGGAAIFLASDAAAYVHGITLPVDGGFLASGARGI